MRMPATIHAPMLAVLATASLLVPPAHAARRQSLTLTSGVSTFYDDNILSYSAGQISDFEQSLHPDHYTIETRDDLLLNPSLSLGWALDQGHGRRHSLRLKGEGDFHRKNANVDYRSMSATWRESWSRDRRLSVSYFVLPHYYLRQLFDDDAQPAFVGLTRYRRAEFGLRIATAGWAQRLGRRVVGEIGYQYEGRDYTHEFDERDSRLHQGAAVLSFVRLPHRATVGLHGGYRVSHAKGGDGDEPETTPDPDISYHGILLGASGRMELARSGPWRIGGDLAYDLETRSYDSDRPTDKYHFGRSDVLHAVELGLRTQYRPHWSLRGFYRFETNGASLGASAPLSADAGSYRQNQAGLALEWSGDLWHHSQAGSESDTEGQP